MKEGDIVKTPVGKLELIEFLPYEPSAYVNEEGWLAVRKGQVWEFPQYFLAVSGSIEAQHFDGGKWTYVGTHDLVESDEYNYYWKWEEVPNWRTGVTSFIAGITTKLRR